MTRTPTTGTHCHNTEMYIDGQWVVFRLRQRFENHNPYTGKPWALIPPRERPDVDHAVGRLRAKRSPPAQWAEVTPRPTRRVCSGAG